jgi:hypothetical protein
MAVRRPGKEDAPQRADAIECVSFAPEVQEEVASWSVDDVVEVLGSVRRRWWGGGNSSFEIEVSTARRIATAPPRKPRPTRIQPTPTPSAPQPTPTPSPTQSASSPPGSQPAPTPPAPQSASAPPAPESPTIPAQAGAQTQTPSSATSPLLRSVPPPSPSAPPLHAERPLAVASPLRAGRPLRSVPPLYAVSEPEGSAGARRPVDAAHEEEESADAVHAGQDSTEPAGGEPGSADSTRVAWDAGERATSQGRRWWPSRGSPRRRR